MVKDLFAYRSLSSFCPGVNTAWHFGQRISVKLTRWVSFGGIWYRHLGHSVVNDAMTLALSILRPIISSLSVIVTAERLQSTCPQRSGFASLASVNTLLCPRMRSLKDRTYSGSKVCGGNLTSPPTP
jgi:hypothetical protein